MISNRELRQNARGQLGGGIFQNYWLMILLACLIVSALLSASVFTFFGVFILTGPLQYGLFRVLTDRVRGREKVEFGDLFKGFEENFSGTLVLGILQSIFIFLWSLLLIVPGIVKSYSYSMSYYLQQEDKSKDWKACLDESRSRMNGHKGQLFLLDLSFIGWYIVGLLCLGVGALFVVPYHDMARTNFFMALQAEQDDGIEELRDGGGYSGEIFEAESGEKDEVLK